MDRPLNAQVKLDAAAENIRIDVLGSLTHDSRSDLTELIARIRQAGMDARICVDLSQAELVESAALAGLRHDLDAVSGSAPSRTDPARTHSATGGVSLELRASADDDAKDFQPLHLTSNLRPDDPSVASSRLSTTFDQINLETTRREAGH